MTAESEDGEVMAVEHTKYSIYGVQFHPESVMTPDGKIMIENFMDVVRGGRDVYKRQVYRQTFAYFPGCYTENAD